MIWRAVDQLVVQLGEAFWVIDATGAVTTRFEPSTWSVDDDLGRITFEVRDGQLVEHTAVEHWGPHGGPLDTRELVMLEGLVADATAETRRFVDVVLGDDAVKREEQRLAQEAEAEARVAAIEGARDELGLGAQAARAQQALIERVRRYADDRAAALLSTLIVFARQPPSAAAITAFVRGCLLATFSPNPPALVEEPPRASPLAERVAGHAEVLQRDADHQSEIDAPANARELWQAAEAMRACARLLGRRTTTS